MDQALCNEVVSLLKVAPELYDPLNTAVKIQLEKQDTYDWKGFEWHELPAQPQTMKTLVLRKIFRVSDKSRNRTRYQLTDVEGVREGLKITAVLMLQLTDPAYAEREQPISPSIFDDVLGYEDVKDIFLNILLSDKEDRVHPMLIGPPASAKSLFLFCLEKLPKAKYVLGSRISRAGLADYLITHKPRFLLVDEVDKMDANDYAILLSLCESGRVTEMLYGKVREVQLDTIVFASGNRTKGMPPEVISRFQELHFRPYTQTEFTDIVNHVLTRRQMPLKLATYIAIKVSEDLGSRDVRQALRVAKLAKTKNQVDSLVRTLKRYEARKERYAGV